MTFHFSEFNAPPALKTQEKEIKEKKTKEEKILSKEIEAICQDLDCLYRNEATLQKKNMMRPVHSTKPKMRCVL